MTIDRAKDYSGLKKHEKELSDLYAEVVQAFDDKNEQIEAIQRFWQIYNCEMSTHQAYQGETQVYLPIVHSAVEARVTRFVNMLFPENGRHVDVVSYPGDNPYALMSLLDHYVRKAKVRSLSKALLRNGEVEGQYSIYVYWNEVTRYVTKKQEKQVEISKGVFDPDETYLDAEDDEITDAFPAIELISAGDLAVTPATATSIEIDAETVTRKLWLTKDGVRGMIRKGLFQADAGEKLIEMFGDNDPAVSSQYHGKQATAAGVRQRAGKVVACVYETWAKMKLGGDKKGRFRWVRVYFGDKDLCLGMTVNPFWNDRCPILSAPRNRLEGSFWGKSPIDAVEQTQYLANDFVNMAGDSAQYSLMPITFTDPEKNPNIGSMVLNMAAIWATSPQDTQFASMPQLWKDALEFVSAAKSQILESFGLNPAVIAQGSSPRKPTQAEVAQEQQVTLENIGDEVTTLEDDIYTPMLQYFFEYDQQHRDDDLYIRMWGQLGIDAKMQAVPPFAWEDRFEFNWRGVETFKSAQASQQQIAALNVLRSLPPVLPDGKRIDISPIVEALVEGVFGPRVGARILVDQRDQLTVDPKLENDIMRQGGQMPVHWLDDDSKHVMLHSQAAEFTGDPSGFMRAHIALHMAQLQMKNQQAQPQGLPGATGAPAGAPGIAGTPRPGAVPLPPPGGQGPPGMIHSDQLQDAGRMPRRATG